MKSKVSSQKKFKIFMYVELAAAVLFSFLCLHFAADISVLAFPVSAAFTAITVYFAIFRLIIPQNGRRAFAVLKLIQYLPFVLLLSFILRRAGRYGTSYAFDVISVILWIVVFVFSLVISSMMSDKRIKTLTEGWRTPVKAYKKPKGMGRIAFEVVDWIDALVQAVFTVLLIQIFILQLYVIPSESMVPTFLIKDKVLVSKISSGPKFPLTQVGLPAVTRYKRGDIVVVRNPHYSMERKDEVRTVVSQLVYMLTFMSVNLNKDENGELKADPLVKRIAGEQGEQLVMQDGILYARTRDNPVFYPVVKDQQFAAWNLNSLDQKIRSHIETIPLSSANYEKMLAFEEKRRSYDLEAASVQAEELARKFKELAYSDNLAQGFSAPNLNEFELFYNVQKTAMMLMGAEGGAEWFEKFMTSWIPFKADNRDVYAESNFRLDVMTKICFGKIVVEYAELIRNNVSSASWRADPVLSESLELAEELIWYVCELLDERNMPVFPSNDSEGNPQFIPKSCFFMMGDNRFNSLDMRHSYDPEEKALSAYDPLSVTYKSIMEPQYVSQGLILGKPKFRFWPLNRLGSLHN